MTRGPPPAWFPIVAVTLIVSLTLTVTVTLTVAVAPIVAVTFIVTPKLPAEINSDIW